MNFTYSDHTKEIQSKTYFARLGFVITMRLLQVA